MLHFQYHQIYTFIINIVHQYFYYRILHDTEVKLVCDIFLDFIRKIILFLLMFFHLYGIPFSMMTMCFN